MKHEQLAVHPDYHFANDIGKNSFLWILQHMKIEVAAEY
jgi:hypothetical protein